MAPQKSPAFSFYAKDFLTGTATMSLVERGAYVTLLAHEWDAGFVPAEPMARARVLGCTPTHERSLWKTLAVKFVRQGEGLVNTRLEQERQKQIDRRQKLAENGSKGGVATAAKSQQLPEQMAQQKGGLPSSSSFSEEQNNTHNAPARANGHGRGANTPGALQRDHRFHGHCGAKWRFCLSEKTSAELIGKWGGDVDAASKAVQEFVDDLERTVGEGAKGDHVWLLQHFEVFMAVRGREPVPAPSKPKPSKTDGVAAEIEAWGRE